MDIRPLDDRLHAAPQVMAAQMAELAVRGYCAVICNRPDGEEPDQPEAAALRAAAEAAGLDFHHIPVRPGAPGEAEVIAFRQALGASAGPVLGFCRTGTRTTMLWALAEAGRRSAEELIGCAAAAGYDLAVLRPRLEMAGGPGR